MSDLECIKLDNLSWANICQNIVETIGKVLRIDIVILLCNDRKRAYLPKSISTTEQSKISLLSIGCSNHDIESKKFSRKYFIYQKSNSPILEAEILKLTVQSVKKITVIDDLANDLIWQKKCQNNSRIDSAYKQANIRSSIHIPIIGQENLELILTLHNCHQVRSWQPEEINLAIMMANQAINAIANNQEECQTQMQALDRSEAYERMKTSVQRESTINRITNAIRSSLEPQLIFNTIVQELGKALVVDSCALSLWTKRDIFVKCVALYNPQEIRLIPQETQNWQRTTISLVPIAENPILQKLLTTKKTVHLDDLTQHQDLARYELPWHSTSIALLVVPLILDNEIMGSLTLRQSKAARIWCKSEIELAEVVSAQAAIAVQQSRLYETTRRQAKQLEASEKRVKQLNSYLTESILKRFLPEAIVNKAAIGQLALDLNPEPYRVTILFCDLVGFTHLCSHLESSILAELLNDYLEAMTLDIFAKGGTVDKFIGDGIMALFGAPEELSRREQAVRSIYTAKAMQNSLIKLNEKWKVKKVFDRGNIPFLKLRCGIHQGLAVVGMFGGKKRKDYTAIGKAVNIAARLQEAAEPNSILVSEAVLGCLTAAEIKAIAPKLVEQESINYNFFCYSIPI